MLILRVYSCSARCPSPSSLCRSSLKWNPHSFITTIFRSAFSTRSSPPNAQTYYEILGVKANCTQKDIRSAYLELCKQCHPDKIVKTEDDGASPDANARFQRINEAYNCLSKENERLRYDFELSMGQPSTSSASGPGNAYAAGRPFRRPRYPRHFAEYYDNFTYMHQGHKYKRPTDGKVSQSELFGKSLTTFVLCCLIIVTILQAYSEMLDIEMRKMNTERRFEMMSQIYNHLDVANAHCIDVCLPCPLPQIRFYILYHEFHSQRKLAVYDEQVKHQLFCKTNSTRKSHNDLFWMEDTENSTAKSAPSSAEQLD